MGNGCIANTYPMCSDFFARWIFENDKFIHDLIFTYNEVMHILDLVVWLHTNSHVSHIFITETINVII